MLLPHVELRYVDETIGPHSIVSSPSLRPRPPPDALDGAAERDAAAAAMSVSVFLSRILVTSDRIGPPRS